ncbi:MAG: saccharopine dehydrogenase C-terminal domain-containing protein, partial [Bacteroidota bacterium]
ASSALEPALVANLPSRNILFPRLSSEFAYSDAECKVVQELWDYLGIWDLVEALRNPRTVDTVGLDANANTRWPSPADWLEARMTERMSLSPSDRDMVLMTHLIRTKNPDGQSEIHRCTLCLEGEGGDKSAMAKTVGLPLALAVELYLQGKIQDTGLIRPLGSQWYSSILPALENLGIRMQHTVTMA